MDKIKIKLLEKRNQHIHYEIWNEKIESIVVGIKPI